VASSAGASYIATRQHGSLMAAANVICDLCSCVLAAFIHLAYFHGKLFLGE